MKLLNLFFPSMWLNGKHSLMRFLIIAIQDVMLKIKWSYFQMNLWQNIQVVKLHLLHFCVSLLGPYYCCIINNLYQFGIL